MIQSGFDLFSSILTCSSCNLCEGVCEFCNNTHFLARSYFSGENFPHLLTDVHVRMLEPIFYINHANLPIPETARVMHHRVFEVPSVRFNMDDVDITFIKRPTTYTSPDVINNDRFFWIQNSTFFMEKPVFIKPRPGILDPVFDAPFRSNDPKNLDIVDLTIDNSRFVTTGPDNPLPCRPYSFTRTGALRPTITMYKPYFLLDSIDFQLPHVLPVDWNTGLSNINKAGSSCTAGVKSIAGF